MVEMCKDNWVLRALRKETSTHVEASENQEAKIKEECEELGQGVLQELECAKDRLILLCMGPVLY